MLPRKWNLTRLFGQMIGSPGEGVKTIMDMVTLTRLIAR